jgi:hypothetical protein
MARRSISRSVRTFSSRSIVVLAYETEPDNDTDKRSAI